MGYSWQFALTAILLEGILFIILTLTKVRTMIVEAIPRTLKKAITCGIGMYFGRQYLRRHNAGHYLLCHSEPHYEKRRENQYVSYRSGYSFHITLRQ